MVRPPPSRTCHAAFEPDAGGLLKASAEPPRHRPGLTRPAENHQRKPGRRAGKVRRPPRASDIRRMEFTPGAAATITRIRQAPRRKPPCAGPPRNMQNRRSLTMSMNFVEAAGHPGTDISLRDRLLFALTLSSGAVDAISFL